MQLIAGTRHLYDDGNVGLVRLSNGKPDQAVHRTAKGPLSTLLGHSAQHSERLFLPDCVEKLGWRAFFGPQNEFPGKPVFLSD
jgi:hypothetical protein